jgi:hypothetical protein
MMKTDSDTCKDPDTGGRANLFLHHGVYWWFAVCLMADWRSVDSNARWRPSAERDHITDCWYQKMEDGGLYVAFSKREQLK